MVVTLKVYYLLLLLIAKIPMQSIHPMMAKIDRTFQKAMREFLKFYFKRKQCHPSQVCLNDILLTLSKIDGRS